VNRSRAVLARQGRLPGGAAPACPTCGNRLEFDSDRMGRTVEYCGCGHSAPLLRRVIAAVAAKPRRRRDAPAS